MKNKEKNFVSAVIYVHNAEDRIEPFLGDMIGLLEENFEYAEIICVNDASSDNSLDRIRKGSRMAESISVSVVNMSFFHGVELSMNAGVDLSIGDFVFEFDNTDADFDFSFVIGIYRQALTGYDIVSASPDKKEKFSSRFFYEVFNRFTDFSGKMETESFRVLSRRVINRIGSMNRTVPYRKAIYANCGLKIENMRYPVAFHDSVKIDKKEKRYKVQLAVDTLLLFTEVGYRFSMGMTVVMMLMSILMVVYSLVTWFVIHPVEGWTTTILFLSVAFLGLFGILTMIVKYLQLLVKMVFKRKQYSFESIEKLTK